MYATLSYGVVSYGGQNYSHSIVGFGAPTISFRSDSYPYALLSPISYIQSAPDSGVLPVLSGEKSNENKFRIYNNFELTTHVADALNVQITTYDGLGSSSKTAIKSVVNQKWLKLYQTGYGQSASTPAPLSNWYADELAVGGDSTYFLEKNSQGSNAGSSGSSIKAGFNGNGCGFIELGSYLEVPSSASMGEVTFVITAIYDWVS